MLIAGNTCYIPHSIDIGQFHLIITKLKNNIYKGNYHNTPKFYEDIQSFRVKMGHMNFAMFFVAAELSVTLHVFQQHISVRNMYMILTKFENELKIRLQI